MLGSAIPCLGGTANAQPQASRRSRGVARPATHPQDFIQQHPPASVTPSLPPQVLRTFEFQAPRGCGRPYKFDVLLTTYEMVLKDAAVLRPIR